MGKRLDCEDRTKCGYSVCAQTEQEVAQKIGEHIQAIDALKGFSKEFYRKALAAIREEKCDTEKTPEEIVCEACDGACLC